MKVEEVASEAKVEEAYKALLPREHRSDPDTEKREQWGQIEAYIENEEECGFAESQAIRQSHTRHKI